MLIPITFENEAHLLHSFRAEDVDRIETICNGIYEILSDEQTLTFIPEKRIRSLVEAESLLASSIINYHARRNFLHFITDTASGKVIGMIDLISPELAKEHYKIDQYPYFIEFYLISSEIGKGITSNLLPLIAKQIITKGIPDLSAVVNRNNLAAVKVLKKANFVFKQQFDVLQDLYILSVDAR